MSVYLHFFDEACHPPHLTAPCSTISQHVDRHQPVLIRVGVLQVETIMLSIISMLSSPNDESPANIDAAKEWRDERDSFRRRVSRIVRKSQEML